MKNQTHTIPKRSKKDKQPPPPRAAAITANQVIAPARAAKAVNQPGLASAPSSLSTPGIPHTTLASTSSNAPAIPHSALARASSDPPILPRSDVNTARPLLTIAEEVQSPPRRRSPTVEEVDDEDSDGLAHDNQFCFDEDEGLIFSDDTPPRGPVTPRRSNAPSSNDATSQSTSLRSSAPLPIVTSATKVTTASSRIVNDN